jgi:hypothetical protein
MVREGQGLEDIEAHHGANVGVLEQDDLPLIGLYLRAHGALLLSLESFSSRCHGSAVFKKVGIDPQGTSSASSSS